LNRGEIGVFSASLRKRFIVEGKSGTIALYL